MPLRSTVGRESTTFGFSILATGTFGLLNVKAGSPGVAHIFLFSVGAVGTSMNVLSVVGGLGRAWLAATWIAHPAVWAVAPSLAAVVYLVFESLETAPGERLLKATDDPEADDVSS